jgi:hypothetical protein
MALLSDKIFKFVETNRYNSLILELLYLNHVDVSRYGLYINRVCDYIDFKDMESVSYTPIKDGQLQEKHRTSSRFGRLISKLINKTAITSFNITSRQFEDCVNLYKNYFDSNLENLKILSGSDILSAYLENNYLIPQNGRIGSLWKSCMRYDYKNQFMDFYVKNSDIVSLLVLYSNCGKVKGRALLWNCKDINGRDIKIMDRIYVVYEHNLNLFKDWAKLNGYVYKLEQSNKCEMMFDGSSGPHQLDITIPIPVVDFKYYPYMDTFKFFSIDSKFISNSDQSDYDYILVQNYGALTEDEDVDNKNYFLGSDDSDSDLVFDDGGFNFYDVEEN